MIWENREEIFRCGYCDRIFDEEDLILDWNNRYCCEDCRREDVLDWFKNDFIMQRKMLVEWNEDYPDEIRDIALMTDEEIWYEVLNCDTDDLESFKEKENKKAIEEYKRTHNI